MVKLTSSDPYFVSAVAIDGDLAVVGACCQSGPGKAYVFARNMGGPDAWGEVGRLIPDRPVASTFAFGLAIALSGDVALVADLGDDLYSPGAVYVFERNASGSDAWEQTAV